MAILKSTTIAGGGTGYLRLPIGNDAARPTTNFAVGTNTVTNASAAYMRINSTSGNLEVYSGGTWESTVIAFAHRSIITNAYMQGGYKDGYAYSNINRVYAATDTTINLGDITERSHNYQWGACSNDYSYVFGAGNAHAAASNYTIAFNMRTEIQASDISRTLAGTRHTFGGVFQEDRYAFISGGDNARIEEYNMFSKTLIGTISPTFASGAIWGMSHENIGIFYGNGQSTFTFASRTISTRSGTAPGNHHQQKSVMSKYTYSYAGNEGEYAGGATYRKTNMYTDITTTATPAIDKPWNACGEENYTLGQDWQYMLGQHDPSGQNTRSHKFTYATETGVQGGAGLEPKGHQGCSSGVTGWVS